MAAVLASAKVSVFLLKDHKDFTQVFPKVLLGTNTNLEHKNTSKHDASQQALSFNAPS